MGKKKGAANKLAKMSDEEKARYLQHRADIEEEARRRKQQLIAIFLKVIYFICLIYLGTDSIERFLIHLYRIN